MSSKNYEENGHRHNLDLLVISHYFIFHIQQEVGAEKSVQLSPTYLP